MKNLFRSLAVFLTLTGLSALTQAAPIPTLFSTGLSAGGLPLAPGAFDPHYTLILAPAGIPTPAPGVVVGPIPGTWTPNLPTAQWINPTGTGAFVEGGDYWYTTTFDLTGFVASTTYIEGGWAVDDAGMSISLNGLPLAGITTGAPVLAPMPGCTPSSLPAPRFPGFRESTR